MSVKERIIGYVRSKGLSARGFSLSIGMSENYITNMKNSIQPDVVHKLSVLYPDLNTGWLMTGEGDMLKKDLSLTKPEDELKVISDSEPKGYKDSELSREKDARIEDLKSTIEKLSEQLDKANGQIAFLQHVIASQCLDHPRTEPQSGAG